METFEKQNLQLYNFTIFSTCLQVKVLWIIKGILIILQKSTKNRYLDPGNVIEIHFPTLTDIRSIISVYRSLTTNNTDSEINSISSEEMQTIQEDQSLPPRPGIVYSVWDVSFFYAHFVYFNIIQLRIHCIFTFQVLVKCTKYTTYLLRIILPSVFTYLEIRTSRIQIVFIILSITTPIKNNSIIKVYEKEQFICVQITNYFGQYETLLFDTYYPKIIYYTTKINILHSSTN